MEGPLNNLKTSMIQFGRPKKFYNERYKRFMSESGDGSNHHGGSGGKKGEVE